MSDDARCLLEMIGVTVCLLVMWVAIAWMELS